VILIKAEELFSVRDQAVLVTGAGGLGEFLAYGFAANGAKVALASRTPGKASAVAALIAAKGYPGCLALDFDQTRKGDCEDAVARVLEHYGRLDVLVNTAGIGQCFPPEDFPEEEMRRILDVNLTGAVFITQAAGRGAMIPQKSGRVIHIGSIAGVMTHTYESMVYEASKAAVHQMTRSFAVAWARYNINVNCIAPTWINTPMLADVPLSYYENVNAMHPLGRMAESREFIGAAIFLASPASAYMTGQTLFVDGGWTAGRPLQYDKADLRRPAPPPGLVDWADT
jgi:NAD(P)-dependent dehydrogenase (short-subunit alcohol dehydrogenase family)